VFKTTDPATVEDAKKFANSILSKMKAPDQTFEQREEMEALKEKLHSKTRMPPGRK
jgi:L-fucose isomerase-like protein